MDMVDFFKAFDCVKWDLLLILLKARGFSDIWCTWILNILSSAKSAVLVNGSPTAFFRCHRGLKQGDPFSPLLFLLIVDVMSKMISASALSGDLFDLKLKGELNNIRTLQFADDTLIFCRATRKDIHTLKTILHIFGLISGLSMNQSKTHLHYLGRIPNKVIKDIWSLIAPNHHPDVWPQDMSVLLSGSLDHSIDYRIRCIWRVLLPSCCWRIWFSRNNKIFNGVVSSPLIIASHIAHFILFWTGATSSRRATKMHKVAISLGLKELAKVAKDDGVGANF
ncbi:uncharacterized protein LOC109847341 [Asparagus officinalis]|uniref:uncharacterized protein LOC109847341 n=1 Tax=Asparagus officinalis TaxID=4686 RepID=UPI00098DF610|nr:uncharacterized protein LOC109847341 [Asparagus officinalis]